MMKIWSCIPKQFYEVRAMHPQRSNEELADIKYVSIACAILLVPALTGTLIVGSHYAAIGAVLLWASACLVTGGTIGFLFGIPRTGARATPEKTTMHSVRGANENSTLSENSGRPNTNLEEISDWLTKIIVGLGLVHLKTLSDHLNAISLIASASLTETPKPIHQSLAIALIVGFSTFGFVFGYLYTRLFLQGAIIRSDKSLSNYEKTVNSILSSRLEPSVQVDGEPSIPTIAERVAAERVLKAAPLTRPDEALAPLRALAREYERLRELMSYGPSRTREMREIASNMRKVGLPAKPWLNDLMRSESPGDRLAAIMILQVQFDPQYIPWLASRVEKEPNFPAYQAVSALLARAKDVGGDEAQQIRKAVSIARDSALANGFKIDSSLMKLIESLLTSISVST